MVAIKIIGGRVFGIDRESKALFTKTEVDKAKARYIKEFAKSIVKQQTRQ